MNDEQRQAVIGSHTGDDEPEPYEVDGKCLLEAVEEFKSESLAGAYWAPFKVNSKNYMQVPAERITPRSGRPSMYSRSWARWKPPKPLSPYSRC